MTLREFALSVGAHTVAPTSFEAMEHRYDDAVVYVIALDPEHVEAGEQRNTAAICLQAAWLAFKALHRPGDQVYRVNNMRMLSGAEYILIVRAGNVVAQHIWMVS
jgi:hypothetical protein